MTQKLWRSLVLFLPLLAATLIVVREVQQPPASSELTVNDATKLNPIVVKAIVTPESRQEIQDIVRNHHGPISVGGARFSMGGQIATDGALFIDMKRMNMVLDFEPDKKLITVQVGMRWRDLQRFIDPFNLSVEIMQSYDNFSVGGSLSVNVHGRYVGLGPIILSIRSIRLVLADGSLVEASPTHNSDLYYGAIGGYGGIGVITDATLELADNATIKRRAETMPVEQYPDFFFKEVRNSKTAVFHNADLYPPQYETICAVTWSETTEPVTETARLQPISSSHWINNFFYYWMTELPYGYYVREHIVDPYRYARPFVAKRNYEASYDVGELMPLNHGSSVYVLQEYFVPVDRFDEFIRLMRRILQREKVKVLNISIRHARKDPGSILAWARQEVFAFVIYYKQGTSVQDQERVEHWTQQLIDAALQTGGSYYLPYQLAATPKQFHLAYPNADRFFAVKHRYDPENKFRNRLWDKYYRTAP